MGPEDHGPLSRDVCFGGKFGPDLLSKSLSAFEPGCVKTHTSAKCRKNNSPTRYRAESAQDDLAPLCAISPRCFYVRGARWSFHTAKVHTGLAAPRIHRTGTLDSVGQSLWLDAGEPDYLAPFLCFVGDELAERGGRSWQRHVSEVSETGVQLGIDKPGVDRFVQQLDNVSRGVAGRADPI